ncbi:MAG: helix-turn-helix transcriptional regulator [Thermodesulfobacteriota bacterium]
MSARRKVARPSREALLLGLIDLAYEAALDPAHWLAFLETLAAATRSASATLTLHDLGAATRKNLWAANADPALVAEDELWAPRNPFIAAAASLIQTGLVCRSDQVISPREVMRTEYFNEFLRRVGVMNHIGACIARDRDVTSMLFVAKPIGSEVHEKDDVLLVRALLPHLQRALAIHRRFESLAGVSTAVGEVLDRLPFGVVLLDAQRRSVLVNRAASATLAARDGLSLSRQGSVQASAASVGTSLAALIAGACATGNGRGTAAGGTMLVARPSGRRAYAVLVTPLRAADQRLGEIHPVAAVFLSDPERDPETPHDVLRRLYALTPAECAVAWMLLAGKRISDITEELSITGNTARTHVKRILAKAGCRTQAELVRVLLSGPASLLAGEA